MGDPAGSVKPVGGPKYLGTPGFVALVVAFCVVVPVAGAAAKEFDGWTGWAIFFGAWCVMLVGAVAVTRTYANPTLPTLCGVMIGVTFPGVTEEWWIDTAGKNWGKAIATTMAMLAALVGLVVFQKIGKRHRP